MNEITLDCITSLTCPPSITHRSRNPEAPATPVGSRRSLSALVQHRPVSRPNSLHHSYPSACRAESLPPACTASSPLIKCRGARRLGKSEVIFTSSSLSFIFIPEPLSAPFYSHLCNTSSPLPVKSLQPLTPPTLVTPSWTLVGYIQNAPHCHTHNKVATFDSLFSAVKPINQTQELHHSKSAIRRCPKWVRCKPLRERDAVKHIHSVSF